MIFGNSYFSAHATVLAPDLIGKLLCVKTADGTIIKKRITETECYYGEEDSACHAHKGRTKRTETLYHAGGVAYVYLCYGMYDLLNFVTGDQDHPEAVLIRGVEGISGPGRLTKALGITRELNGKELSKENGLWVEDDGVKLSLSSSERIGISYADEIDRKKPWRFFATNNFPVVFSNK